MAEFENPLEQMMQGLMSGNIWEMDMVQQVIFPSRQTEAEFMGATSGPKRDGRIEVAPGIAVGWCPGDRRWWCIRAPVRSPSGASPRGLRVSRAWRRACRRLTRHAPLLRGCE